MLDVVRVPQPVRHRPDILGAVGQESHRKPDQESRLNDSILQSILSEVIIENRQDEESQIWIPAKIILDIKIISYLS